MTEVVCYMGIYLHQINVRFKQARGSGIWAEKSG